VRTLYYSHPDFLLHDTGQGHPECADRLRAISKALAQPMFADLIRMPAPMATEQQIRLIHPLEHSQRIRDALPTEGLHYLDADTVLSPGSEKAAYLAVGAVCDAVDQIMADKADNAFLRGTAHLDIMPNRIRRWVSACLILLPLRLNMPDNTIIWNA
jgi:acetoin utilization deacetylase AcuC-like enzyme